MPNLMSQAEPIKVGLLMDYISDSRSMDDVSIFSEPLDLVFRQGQESGLIDRSVESRSTEVRRVCRGGTRRR